MTIINFSKCDEFQKEMKKLYKSYPSLLNDFNDLLKILANDPTGQLVAERINQLGESILLPVYKIKKFACKSLRSTNKLRIIYVYDDTKKEIQFIQFLEIYAKADKENEDRKRIYKYCRWKSTLAE